MNALAGDWELLTQRVGAVRHKRDIVRVFGSDAVSFLQTQLTQDVSDLSPGESRWSFILEPKGRVEAFVRIWGRLGDSEILLDVEHGGGQAVIDRLNRFRIRTKVELEVFSWDCVSLRGPQSLAVVEKFHSELMTQTSLPAIVGVDLLGPSVEVPDGIPEVSEDSLELLRVEAGWPSMGREFSELLDPPPITGELGESVVGLAVSFTKGCYTGQELVVRTQSRGNNTPRRLRRLHLSAPAVVDDKDSDRVQDRVRDLSPSGEVPLGATIRVDGEARGTLTSVAALPNGGFVGMGFIHRSVEDPGVGEIEWSSGDSGDSGGPVTTERVEVQILSPVGIPSASATASPVPVPDPGEPGS